MIDKKYNTCYINNVIVIIANGNKGDMRNEKYD